MSVNYATTAPASGIPATAGDDFTPVSGVLTFAPGQTARTFTVPIIADTVDEPNKTVGLLLSDPTGGAALGSPITATLRIIDDDVGGVVQFAQSSIAVVEGTQVSIVVTRSGGSAGGVSVDWSATHISTDASDFSPTSGTLTFGPGVSSQTIVLTLNDDGIEERPEAFTLMLANPTGGATLGARKTLAVTLTDKTLTQPTVHFTCTSYSVVEGDSLARNKPPSSRSWTTMSAVHSVSARRCIRCARARVWPPSRWCELAVLPGR